MRDPHHLLHRHHGAEHVRHVGDRDHLGAVGQELLELVDQEVAVVVDRRPFDHRALALAQEMPGHDVGVMLHDREHDLVARLDALAPEGVGDEVDRLGGIAGEDDLLRPLGVEERPHLLARALIGLGRGIGEEMQAAMHVGVFRGVGLLDAVEHRPRLLRRGGVVEIDERLAVDRHGEDREVLAHFRDVEAAVDHRGVHGDRSFSLQSARRARPGSRRSARRGRPRAGPPRSPRRRTTGSAAPRPRAPGCRAPSGRT